MKKQLITAAVGKIAPLLVALFSAGAYTGYAQDYAWVTHYPEPSDVRARNITTAPSGANYQMVKHADAVTLGGETFSGNGQVLVRHNAAGDFSWARECSEVDVNALKATDEHVYLAGNYQQAGAFIAGHTFTATAGFRDGFVVRLTHQGIVDLVITIAGSENDQIVDLDVDKNGVMWVTGYGSDTLFFRDTVTSHQGMSYLMAKFLHDGSTDVVSRSNAATGRKITTNSESDRIFVSAVPGDEQATTVFSDETHTFSSSDSHNGDNFIVAYDNNGNLLNTQTQNSSFRRSVVGMDATENSDFYVLINHQYGEATVSKYDMDLNQVWVKVVPGRWDYPMALATDLIGNLFTTGTLLEHNHGYYTVINKYSTDGNLLWNTDIMVPEGDDQFTFAETVGIDTDDLGDAYISGFFNVAADFKNHGSYESGGSFDFFAARIDGQSDYSSIASHTAGSLKVFPTISSGAFKIQFENPAEGTFAIRDITGRTVYATNTATRSSLQQLNVSLQDGIYILEFEGRDHVLSESRIIIRN